MTILRSCYETNTGKTYLLEWCCVDSSLHGSWVVALLLAINESIFGLSGGVVIHSVESTELSLVW